MDSRYLLVLSVFILATGLILFMEWKRASKKNRLPRLLTIFLAIGSLFFLLFPPHFMGFHTANKKGKTGIILSPGFNKNNLVYNSGDILLTKDSTLKANFPKAQYLSNFWGLKKWFPDIDHIQIEGYGLNSDDLKALKNYPIQFHPSPLPTGIITCHWPEFISSGSTFWVQGLVHNPGNTDLKLVLKGEGRNQDSIMIPSKSNFPFSLTGYPVGFHHRAFELFLLHKHDTINHEPVPFQISLPDSIHIAFLTSSPNYEIRFLKNWLKDKGFDIWSQTSLSNNKTSQVQSSSLNKPSLFTERGINSFDLLITDPLALRDLKPHESSIIQKALVQNGMGIIILLDSVRKESKSFIPKISINKDALDSNAKTLLYFLKPDRFSNPVSNSPLYLDKSASIQSMVMDGKSRMKVGKMILGEGSLILSCLDKTYTWKLEGNSNEYSTYWSFLMEESLKKTNAPSLFWSENGIPKPGREIAFYGYQNQRPELKGQGLYSSFSQNPFLPFLWSGTFWTYHSGWTEYPGNSFMHESIYIYKNSDWLNLEYARNSQITQEASRNPLIKQKSYVSNSYSQTDFIYKLILFLILVVSFSYLWAEKKFWSE